MSSTRSGRTRLRGATLRMRRRPRRTRRTSWSLVGLSRPATPCRWARAVVTQPLVRPRLARSPHHVPGSWQMRLYPRDSEPHPRHPGPAGTIVRPPECSRGKRPQKGQSDGIAMTGSRFHQQEDPGNPRVSRTFTVGVTGFEPATLCSQSRCATKLRYTPSHPVARVSQRRSGSATLVRAKAATMSHGPAGVAQW